MNELELRETRLSKYKLFSYLLLWLLFIAINLKLFTNNVWVEFSFASEKKYLLAILWYSFVFSFLIGSIVATETMGRGLHWIFWPTASYFLSIIVVTESLLLIWGLFTFNFIVAVNSYLVQKKHEEIAEEKFINKSSYPQKTV